jgi:hypothetical protein
MMLRMVTEKPDQSSEMEGARRSPVARKIEKRGRDEYTPGPANMVHFLDEIDSRARRKFIA